MYVDRYGTDEQKQAVRDGVRSLNEVYNEIRDKERLGGGGARKPGKNGRAAGGRLTTGPS